MSAHSGNLRLCNLDEERPLEASKWLQIQMLIDAEELKNLFSALEPFFIYKTAGISKIGEGEVSQEQFLAAYSSYIASLKAGEQPDPSRYRPYFSTVFTKSCDVLFAARVGVDEQIVRVAKPSVQLQANAIHYSRLDGQFRAMVFGPDSISWGLQFSYPQLYRDHKDMQVHKVDGSDEFPNTSLFKAIQNWQRTHTIPTPFSVDGKKINVPMRIGKNCVEWINNHPQLVQQEIRVIV